MAISGSLDDYVIGVDENSLCSTFGQVIDSHYHQDRPDHDYDHPHPIHNAPPEPASESRHINSIARLWYHSDVQGIRNYWNGRAGSQ